MWTFGDRIVAVLLTSMATAILINVIFFPIHGVSP